MIIIFIIVLGTNHRIAIMIETIANAPVHPSIRDLSHVERLLVHALRLWVADRRRWPEVVLEFNRVCRPRVATVVCESLESLFHTLGLHARRRVRLHRPVCCRVSPDELCLLNLIAARQSHDETHADALANWLVPRSTAAALVSDIDRIAGELTAVGCALRVRTTRADSHIASECGAIHILR